MPKGRSVLNMFCYTGGFSFYAMRGGANLVHSVDSSAKAIDLTNENVELNFPGDARHQAFAEDAFKFLDRMGDQYDLIILDPPAFAKHRDCLAQCPERLYQTECKGFRKDSSGRHPVHFLLLAGGQQTGFPQCGLYGCCPERTQRADSPSADSAGRSSGEYLPSRRRLPQGTGTLRGII